MTDYDIEYPNLSSYLSHNTMPSFAQKRTMFPTGYKAPSIQADDITKPKGQEN